MIPDAGAGRDEVPNVYGAATASPGVVPASAHRAHAGSQWEGRDAKDNLQVGSLVPDAGAGMGIGFEGAYGSEWEGRGLRRNHRPDVHAIDATPHRTHWLISHRSRLARQLTNG